MTTHVRNQYQGKIIFKAQNKDYSFDDLAAELDLAGIKAGDTVMAHFDLSVLGKIADIKDRRDFANVFIDAFLTILGPDGTLAVPTFSYSFCKDELYDPEITPSAIGLLPEIFRKRPEAVRSIHPIFSVAAIGPKAKELTANLSKNSFGIGSIYDKLAYTPNAKYVIFGVNYFACTQVHYIEELSAAPYRFQKQFSGTIRHHGHEYSDSYTFFVRYLSKNVNTTFDKIEQYLINKGSLQKTLIGNSNISVVAIDDICRYGFEAFRKDPYIFLETIPQSPIKQKLERLKNGNNSQGNR